MEAVLLIGRLALAGVLVVAAVAKLMDRQGARRAFGDLGVPVAAASAAVMFVTAAELAVAAALVPAATAVPGAIGAAALLAAFTAVVGVAVARGSDAECHCFGNVSSRPVGPGTLVRNIALLALAGAVAAGGGGASATGWTSELSTVEAALAGVCALLALGVAFNAAFLVQLFRQNGRLLAELEDLRSKGGGQPDALQVGEFVPDFALPDPTGRQVELDELLDGQRDLMLLFTAPDCGACDPLLPAVGRAQRDTAADRELVLVSVGDPAGAVAKASEHGIDRMLIIEEGFDLPRSVGVGGFPGGVILDPDGRLAAEPIMGSVALGPAIGYAADVPQLVQVEGGR